MVYIKTVIVITSTQQLEFITIYRYQLYILTLDYTYDTQRSFYEIKSLIKDYLGSISFSIDFCEKRYILSGKLLFEC